MTVFQGAVDATFAAFGIDAVYTPAGGEPVPVRVIARRPDTIVGFGETRIHAETATFEVRASEVASPRPGDQLTVGGETFVVQGEPERRDPDRLVWTLGCAARRELASRLDDRPDVCPTPMSDSSARMAPHHRSLQDRRIIGRLRCSVARESLGQSRRHVQSGALRDFGMNAVDLIGARAARMMHLARLVTSLTLRPHVLARLLSISRLSGFIGCRWPPELWLVFAAALTVSVRDLEYRLRHLRDTAWRMITDRASFVRTALQLYARTGRARDHVGDCIASSSRYA